MREKKKESQLVPLDGGSESSVGWGSQDWYSFTSQQRREMLHSRSLFGHVDLQLVRSLTSTLTRYSFTPVSGLNRTLFLSHVFNWSERQTTSIWMVGCLGTPFYGDRASVFHEQRGQNNANILQEEAFRIVYFTAMYDGGGRNNAVWENSENINDLIFI